MAVGAQAGAARMLGGDEGAPGDREGESGARGDECDGEGVEVPGDRRAHVGGVDEGGLEERDAQVAEGLEGADDEGGRGGDDHPCGGILAIDGDEGDEDGREAHGDEPFDGGEGLSDRRLRLDVGHRGAEEDEGGRREDEGEEPAPRVAGIEHRGARHALQYDPRPAARAE